MLVHMAVKCTHEHANEQSLRGMAVHMVIMMIHVKQSAALPNRIQYDMTHTQLSYATFSQVCLSHILGRYICLK